MGYSDRSRRTTSEYTPDLIILARPQKKSRRSHDLLRIFFMDSIEKSENLEKYQTIWEKSQKLILSPAAVVRARIPEIE